MSFTLRVWGLVAALAILATHGAAQTADSSHLPYGIIQDSLAVATIRGSDGTPFPGSWISPAYHYMMTYQPTSRTEFIFTECKKNGKLINLLPWNYNQIISAPAELISYNSRTVNFQVRAGDTISFYREMDWYNPSTNR